MLKKTDSKMFMVLALILAIIIPFVGMICSALIGSIFSLGDVGDVLLQSTLYIVIILFLFVLISSKIYKLKLNEIGFNKYRFLQRFLIGFALAFLLQFIILIIALVLGVIQIESIQLNIFSSLRAFLTLGLTVAIVEEIAFRGFLFGALKSTKNLLFIVMASSIAFTLAHYGNLVGTGLSYMTILPVIGLILSGILFMLLYIRTGSLTLGIALHAGWNFFEAFLGHGVSGEKGSQIFIATTSHGSDILTGGTFGIEASMITIIVLTITIILIYKFYPQSKANSENKLVSIDS